MLFRFECRRWLALVALPLLFTFGCGDTAGGPPDASPWMDDAGRSIVGIETVAAEVVTAGDILMVSCVLVSEDGERYTLPPGETPSVRAVPESSFMPESLTELRAMRAGMAEVSCALGGWGLVDETPARVEVVPAAPVSVVTWVDPLVVEAGESAAVRCDARDAYGNAILMQEFPITMMPSDPGHRVTAGEVSSERAGRYSVSCDSPGATVEPATLSVVPGAPASLILSLVPMAAVYRPGQVIHLVARVEDRYGNEVQDARLRYLVPAGGSDLGEGRIVFSADGEYTVGVEVEGDGSLREEVTVRVDGTGPSFRCLEPLHGAMVDRAPGSITFRGQVEDLSSISEVRVNGSPVTVAADGGFEATLVASQGINNVRLSGLDAGGVEDTHLCSFLLSDDWASEADGIEGAVSFSLRQSGVDDGSRSGASTSLGDLMHTALNSSGLSNSLHTAFLAANPLKPMSCDQDTWFGCAFESRIDYVRNSISGPNTVSLRLRSGGMRIVARMQNVAVRLRISGTIDNEGWVRVSYIEVGANLGVSLSGGRPRLVVDRSSVTTSVGDISTEFSGFSGWFIDSIIVPLARGRIRDLIRDEVRDYVRDDLSALLDDVVGGLDIESLGSRFNVPRLSGSGTIPVNFGVGFTSLSTTSSRMLVGIRTRLSAPAAHARVSLGVPYEGSAAVRDSSEAGAVVAAVHSEVFNHALHAVWRGGLFDGPLAVDAIGGIPRGVRAESTLLLPPVVSFRSSREVQVGLGGMSLALTYPGIFSEPVVIRLGAEASATTSLVGDDLRFGRINIDSLAFSVDGLNLDADSQRVLEGVLTAIVQQVLDESLNDALPSLPIPSFALPSSVSGFGLPVGGELGLTSPSYSMTSEHAVLRGSLGLR